MLPDRSNRAIAANRNGQIRDRHVLSVRCALILPALRGCVGEKSLEVVWLWIQPEGSLDSVLLSGAEEESE